MDIPTFIARCDRYCDGAGVSRVWLSKRLLHDTYRLDALAKGEVDIGVKRIARAAADLGDLEAVFADNSAANAPHPPAEAAA